MENLSFRSIEGPDIIYASEEDRTNATLMALSSVQINMAELWIVAGIHSSVHKRTLFRTTLRIWHVCKLEDLGTNTRRGRARRYIVITLITQKQL